ncbi:epimerase [Ruegeria sp. AD91A]|uniref:epimerase n=1 Tax=Ruegeria sp. AD91A TaxID=2293862 RepID=UPI000E511A6F|nr:epimerase [Ruegeria sp. AD91A]AXT27617.1 epimerase [Ruegeria sp. AD91A]
MAQTALVLGASGRFGRNAALAFRHAGWDVTEFDRRSGTLSQAARGVDVIVNGWNPPYPDWAGDVPVLTKRVIDAASDTGATVIVPGNVYVFGEDTPGPWSGGTPHQATNPLGRIRIDMEEAYRASTVRTILLRAGDFIDTNASGNWFDQVMIKRLSRSQFVYPGDPEAPHAWAFLPDLARAAVALAEIREDLPRFCDVPFDGFTLTGVQIAQTLSQVTGRTVSVQRMKWWPLQVARPFWRMAPCLIEMRYLWHVPHQLDGGYMRELLGSFPKSNLEDALRSAIPPQCAASSTKAGNMGEVLG